MTRYLLYGCGGILLLFCLYHLIRKLAGAPTGATTRAMRSMRQMWKKPSVFRKISDRIAAWVASRIRMNPYSRAELASDISTAGLALTPEKHLANCIVMAGSILLLAPVGYLISPVLAFFILAGAAAVFFLQYKKVSDGVRRKRRTIEYELPRLVAYIKKIATHNRDVLFILDSYRERAGKELRRELDITVADMRSGNYEMALTRMETRVGSAMLGDVVRGLISMLRGDQNEVYWDTLTLRFAEYQRQTLKARAMKIPKKVHRLSTVLMLCFLLIYLVVFVVVISQTMTTILA